MQQRWGGHLVKKIDERALQHPLMRIARPGIVAMENLRLDSLLMGISIILPFLPPPSRRANF